MTLRTKLLLSQAPLALVLTLLGIVSLRTLGDLGRSSQLILQHNYRSVLAAERMKEALERVDRAPVYRALGRLDDSEAQPAPNINAFEDELGVQERNITEPGEADATQALRGEWTRYLEDFRATQRLQDPAALRERYSAVLEPGFLRVKRAADRILAINQDAMVRKSDQARRAAETSRSLVVLATLAALAVGLFASASLTARSLRPLSRLSMAVRRIGEGDLDARARIEGNDELAQVGRELDTMADRLREYRSSSLGELLQAQQASQAAIDSLPDPVVVLGVDGRILNVNQSAETLLQIGAGADPLARVQPDVREAIERVRQHVVGGRGAYVPRGLDDALRVLTSGAERRLLPRATPLYSEQGAVVGATIVLQDVTRLLRFDELKNDLVATVAHEFRTPLTSLRMAIHILVEGTVGPLTEKQADLLYAAREDCERLQGIVDDLLDLSRIQAGKVEVSPTPISSKALVEGAAAAREASAREAGVSLLADIAEPVLPVLADPERVALVFDNLLSNAVRHSPPGGRVVLRAEAEGGKVRFEVADQGSGIPPEYRERVFEKFFRIPGTKGEGIGLGLYISREIVRAHGGDMGADGEPGRGARFWFTLPVPGAASTAPPRLTG
ncbi:MAG TPA: ATP-binding protein [Myxococcales bacterium]|nr:ATP-binding protein [Myxococcales bacterium]